MKLFVLCFDLGFFHLLGCLLLSCLNDSWHLWDCCCILFQHVVCWGHCAGSACVGHLRLERVRHNVFQGGHFIVLGKIIN